MKTLIAVTLAAGALLATSCQPATPTGHPTQSVGLNLHCAPGDSGEYDQQLGWAFCFPATWRALNGERTQKTTQGVDAVFDITDYATGPTNGFFGVFIISSDTRGSAANLQDWINTNIGTSLQLQPIQWGNAIEAYSEEGGPLPRYLALTPHMVVILELHSGPGNLDLKTAMTARFSTWKFTY
ncbi:MAG TPA: hypothetical protein VF137_04175 [Candidatus Dormibacteraeota bacterium]